MSQTSVVDRVTKDKHAHSGKPSLTDKAYGEIRRRILDNELATGTQMLEREVADLLSMSRTPVREALIRLAEDGLVEVRPRHGMRVLPVSPDDMREIYEVLTSLEVTAIGVLAEKGLDAAQLELLESAVAAMDQALLRNDLTAWAVADERFHHIVVDLAGNQRLTAIVSTLWDQAHRLRMATLALRPPPTTSNDDHRAVINALKRGQGYAACRIHREHRQKSGDLLVSLLEKLQGTGL